MKKVKRILETILLIFGGFFLFSGLCLVWVALTTGGVKDRVMSMFAGLLSAVLGVGILYSGYQLRLRRLKEKERERQEEWENRRKAELAEAEAAWKRRLEEENAERKRRLEAETEEEKAARQEAEAARQRRLEEEKAARERCQEAMIEEARKKREKLLETFKDTDPDEAKHIAEWETALESDCALKGTIPDALHDGGLDGCDNATRVDWYRLGPDSNLEKTIEMYAQINNYRMACELRDLHVDSWKETENRDLRSLLNQHCCDGVFLIVSAEQLHALGENTERCQALCREHNLHLVEALSTYSYMDHVSGKTYEVYVGDIYPGMADDAATYGVLYMREK